MKKLIIYHYFPNTLNLYGDRGNVTILEKQLEWRGIEAEIHYVEQVKDYPVSQADLIFIGGGSDSEQQIVQEQLLSIRKELKAAIEDGLAALCICGGYQLLGDYYETANSDIIQGLGILPFYTSCKNTGSVGRLVGNVRVQSEKFGRIVGFENHSGQTFHSFECLGQVLQGYGNNTTEKKEGLLYKNLIGTYLHGPFLSSNVHVSNWLILQALNRKYGLTKLETLECTLEKTASDVSWDKR
ncbi:type 1 glutamine amidotransferase [Bacillus cereus]|uniref:Lipid II isoglutaminyl synthase (glutamine-hydrolyzing) subunit GatD n=1 Tax=Bacillus cereus TaxID=1396 RepID=A0A2B1KMS7_BACCE|nr:glutamine amidotransferase [Bacillus cereus]PFN25997.1 glutamine amidotransferase [Bacillus cereus]